MRISAFCAVLLALAAGYGCSGNSKEKTADCKPPFDPWRADSIAYLYWGSPASPYRDEARYVTFLDSLLTSDSLPQALRERAERRRRIAMMNRPGTIAADFSYLDRKGRKSRLRDLQSPKTLLVFYDPECPHCDDILSSLASSPAINSAIDDRGLTVIAIYAEGKREVWDSSLNDMPANWLVGYDLTGVLDEELYDLPAMPTPYLLDSDKRVILKDPSPQQLVGFISSRAQ